MRRYKQRDKMLMDYFKSMDMIDIAVGVLAGWAMYTYNPLDLRGYMEIGAAGGVAVASAVATCQIKKNMK